VPWLLQTDRHVRWRCTTLYRYE